MFVSKYNAYLREQSSSARENFSPTVRSKVTVNKGRTPDALALGADEGRGLDMRYAVGSSYTQMLIQDCRMGEPGHRFIGWLPRCEYIAAVRETRRTETSK